MLQPAKAWKGHCDMNRLQGTSVSEPFMTSCDNFNRLFLTETVKAKAGELSPNIMHDQVEVNLLIFGDTGLLKS